MTLDPGSRKAPGEVRTQHHGLRRTRHGLMGPVILITIGVIFLVSQFFPDWGVGKTWPVVLIATGLAKLFESALA